MDGDKHLPVDIALLLAVATGLIGYSVGVWVGTGAPANWATMLGSLAIVVFSIRFALWKRKQWLTGLGLGDDKTSTPRAG